MKRRSGDVLRFPTDRVRPPAPPRRTAPSERNGEVCIYTSDAHGGCWSVYHVSRSGNSVGHVGDFLDYADAEKAARDEAARLGAAFNQVPS